MPVHQRQADRGIGVEHLLGRDDLDLDRVDVEPQLVERDVLDRVMDLAQLVEIPFGPVNSRVPIAGDLVLDLAVARASGMDAPFGEELVEHREDLRRIGDPPHREMLRAPAATSL